MKINKKQCKCKRKVFILNYKWETFLKLKDLIRNTEKLNITEPCNTESSNDEIKRYKLSILKPNIRDRVVPNCFRHKCKKNCYKDHHFREQQVKIKSTITRTHSMKYIHSMKPRHEKLLHPELKYDDISSGSLSSYEDIETLMTSTRTRMKHLKEYREHRPRATSSYPGTNEIRGSMNSLDTLFLGKSAFNAPTVSKNINI